MTPEEWKEYKQQLQIEKPITYDSLNPNDVVFTPDIIAEKIVKLFPIQGTILEPCKGRDAFLKYLPSNSDWCEITEGRDFFKYDKKVDWIVTNPPYSNFNEFLDHSFKLADNIIFLVPFAKVFKSMGTLNKIYKFGGIVCIYFLPASKAGFPFGFPCGIFWFKRGYSGETKIMNFELCDTKDRNGIT